MNLHSTRQRLTLLGLSTAVLAIILTIALTQRPPEEPLLNGQPLSYYLDLQTYGELRTERNARESITDFGTNAVPHLIRILEYRPTRIDSLLESIRLHIPFLHRSRTPLWLRQYQAAIACAELGSHATAAIPALSNLVGEPLLGAPAITALAMISPETFSILTNSLATGVPATRAEAAGMLRLKQHSSAAVPPLLQALQDLVPSVRANAAGSLALVGAHDSRTVPALLQTLNDPHTEVRLEIIQGLGRLGAMATEAAPKLRELLRTEEDPILHLRIEQALEAITSKQTPAP